LSDFDGVRPLSARSASLAAGVMLNAYPPSVPGVGIGNRPLLVPALLIIVGIQIVIFGLLAEMIV
jgi:hypothetical protein